MEVQKDDTDDKTYFNLVATMEDIEIDLKKLGYFYILIINFEKKNTIFINFDFFLYILNYCFVNYVVLCNG